MKAATKRILCYILLCLFVLTTITASLTFGRYTSEKASDNDYKGDIEYILGDAIIINTIEDFFQAIENGYSNIQLGDELDNPLIISGGMSGVVSDLIIDLNGHEIQRNNREPILDVKDGINLTIIDTSAEKTGSLYNPVGSVLKVSGGTLTAAAGIFESGPRSGKRDNKGNRVETDSNYNEYAVAKDNTWSARSGGGFDTQTDIQKVQLFERPKDGSGKYEPEGDALLPIITPKYAEATGTNLAVNGNMYFDDVEGQINYYSFTDNQGVVRGIINDDTYLYYTFESENMQFTDTAASGSADYYYRYYVEGDQDNGTVDFGYAKEQHEKVEGDEKDKRVPVTVYVYNNVKGSATEQSSYAAINMADGNLYARAGYYYSYFGKEDTYCVNATGGYMAVTQGQFNAFGNGVGIQCAYGESAEANEYLNITKGTFYSQDGDTIRVSGGMLEVGTAIIEKDATDSADKWFANGSAIDVSGGGVTVNNSLEISVEGSGCAGIRSDGAGAVTANKNCTITLTGDKNVGIYSGEKDGTSQPVIIGSQSSGEVTANITLAEGSSKSYGIYSEGGNVYIAGGGGSATFTLSGTELQGIRSTGGNVNIANGTAGGKVAFDIESQNSENNYSRAIYAEGGSINIGTSGRTGATFNLDGTNVQGINVDGGNVNICTANNAASTATFNLGQNVTSRNISGILTSNDSGAGSAVAIGSTSSTFALKATGTAMSGIYARGGSISLLGKVNFTLDSHGSAEGEGIAGIYSEGGAVAIGAEGTQKIAEFSLSGGYLRGISVSGKTSSATFNGVTTVNMSHGIKDSYGIAASQGTLTFNNSVNITAEGTSTAAYGIYATGAGSVVDIGGATTISYNGSAEKSNAIHNVGGTVAISATTNITFKGGAKNSNGIYNGAEQDIAGGRIGLGYQLNDNNELTEAGGTAAEFTVALSAATKSTGIYSAGGTINISGSKYTSTIKESVGTYLDNASIYATAGTVNFAAAGEDGVTLTSDCLGIVIRGTLNFDSGNVEINTPNGTAIYVYQGSLTAAEDVTVNITSGINGNGWGVEGAESQTNIYNGVFVNGGSLISNGTLNVEHVGVENDNVGEGNNSGVDKSDNEVYYENNRNYYESSDAYYRFNIKSYAIRVEAAEGASSTVTITKGNIVNETRTFDDNGNVVYDDDGNQVEIDGSGGGGIYVSGGTVTLGQTGATGPSITTTGTYAYNEYYHVTGAARNWSAKMPRSGGHAVQVTGGNLTINSGTYSATLGNGILLTNGNITVNGGTIVGGDHEYQSATIGDVPCGAAASYCLKVCGGEIDIQDGVFGSPKTVTATNALVPSSGAFIMGISADNRGTANISKGTFNVGGQAAFAVYQHATVTFGSQATTNQNDNIYVRGLAAGLTVENSAESSIFVTIYNGEFRGFRSGGGDGVWYGEGTAKLTITGGTFGGNRSGLYFDENSWNGDEQKGNVQILGGVFAGVPVSVSNGSYYINGAIGADSTGYNSGLGHDIQITDIIDQSDKRKIYFSSSQTMPGDNEWDYVKLVEECDDKEWWEPDSVVRNRQKLNQTTCKYRYVKVST